MNSWALTELVACKLLVGTPRDPLEPEPVGTHLQQKVLWGVPYGKVPVGGLLREVCKGVTVGLFTT